MAFKLPDWWEKKKQEEHELKYISYNGERIHVSELEDKSVTSEMHKDMRMNSYALEDLSPKLTDETLIEKAKYYKSQCEQPRYPCATYDEALIHNVMPELIKRLEGYKEFYNYFSELYGQGLMIANWHMNDDLESFDSFFDSAEQEMGE